MAGCSTSIPTGPDGNPKQNAEGHPEGALRVYGPYSGPLPHGPVIANVIPGVWMFANSHLPSGL